MEQNLTRVRISAQLSEILRNVCSIASLSGLPQFVLWTSEKHAQRYVIKPMA
jgi:hypothetical protein